MEVIIGLLTPSSLTVTLKRNRRIAAMSSSTPRVQNLRARRAEAGLTHFRMRGMSHEWEEMEQLRAAILSMRGDHVPEPKPYAAEWSMWLTPTETELAQSTRDLIVARRSA